MIESGFVIFVVIIVNGGTRSANVLSFARHVATELF
jgi:hypothetical protein